MQKKYKIGLIGCGRISLNHFDAIKNTPELELVAVCDSRKDHADKAAKDTGAKAYYDYDKMLASDIDVVTICTPSGLHPVHGIQAAKAGKHVITEKPMGVDLKSVDKLIAECKKNKVQLFVVKQNRLNATMQLLKKAIEKGRFGKIYSAYVNVFWQRPQEYYSMSPWRGTWKMDGGAFSNQASHYLDAIVWLVGPVDSVFASTKTMARKIEAEDMGSVIVNFKNGAIGTINVSMLTYPKNYEGSITILGEKGTVKIGGEAINKIEKWEFADYDDDDKEVQQASYNITSVYGFGHQGYYQNVVKALQGEAKANTNGNEGRKAVELTMAIYKSSKTKKLVKFPLK